VGVSLPVNVSYKVASIIENQSGRKAVMESGLEVIVPSFISEGDSIIVTTADGKYVSKG
jgi:elongation factor P